MPKCSACGRGFPDDRMSCCSQCGRAYCEERAEAETSMAALGVCLDCEETWQDEDNMDDDS